LQILVPRKLEYDDLPIRVKWFNTPSVYLQMPLNVPVSLSETNKWFSERLLLNEARRDFAFDINKTNSDNSTLAAMAGLTSIDYQNLRAELYIVVNPDMTGRGIGQEALRWLCNFGFFHLGLNRIFLFTVKNNTGARKFYEKHGFKEEGILREHAFHHGKLIDRHIHGLLRSEWERFSWCNKEFSFKIFI